MNRILELIKKNCGQLNREPTAYCFHGRSREIKMPSKFSASALLFSPRNAAQKLEVVDLGKSSKHSFLALKNGNGKLC